MSWTHDRNLLRRLRELPPPPIPPGLEARLLAGISRSQAGAAIKPARQWTIAAGGAVAAGMLLALGVAVVQRAGVGHDQHVLPREVRPTFVQHNSTPNHKDTRPCDILPPLPRSL